MMNTFAIVNINLTCERYKSMLFHSKRPSFPLQFDQEQNILGQSFEGRAY